MNAHQKESIQYLRGKGYSYSKISEQLGISENTVKSFCRRNNQRNTPDEISEKSAGIICLLCGKTLKQTAGAKPKKFCSDQCRMAWWNSHPEAVKHKAVQQITCQTCGKVFTCFGNRKRKYCSRSCYAKSKAVRA